MVFFALDDNNEIIIAEKANKYNNYKCNYCKEKLIHVSKSKDKKSYFRHQNDSECSFHLEFNNNIKIYSSDFHIKWTTNFIDPKYLYHYWNNKKIADIFYNNFLFIIRTNILKNSDYTNIDNVIWILDGINRKGNLIKIIYDNNEEDFYYKTIEYDYNKISDNHDIILDNGTNQLIKLDRNTIIKNIDSLYIRCQIINIHEFIDNNFKDITINEFEIIDNINIDYNIYFSYKLIQEEIIKFNEENSDNLIIDDTINCRTYNKNLSNQLNRIQLEEYMYDIEYKNKYNHNCYYCDKHLINIVFIKYLLKKNKKLEELISIQDNKYYHNKCYSKNIILNEINLDNTCCYICNKNVVDNNFFNDIIDDNYNLISNWKELIYNKYKINKNDKYYHNKCYSEKIISDEINLNFNEKCEICNFKLLNINNLNNDYLLDEYNNLKSNWKELLYNKIKKNNNKYYHNNCINEITNMRLENKENNKRIFKYVKNNIETLLEDKRLNKKCNICNIKLYNNAIKNINDLLNDDNNIKYYWFEHLFYQKEDEYYHIECYENSK